MEDKVRNSLECIGTGDHFLNITPAAQTQRETINKWDLLKLYNFCKAKNSVNKIKQSAEWKKKIHKPQIRQ